MTDNEILDMANSMIPLRGGKLTSMGSMKRIEWQWKDGRHARNHAMIVGNGANLIASEFRNMLDIEIECIKKKYPDENFITR